ncbi:hypothetical protein ACVSQB_13140 [Bradyrhizobium elkanii]
MRDQSFDNLVAWSDWAVRIGMQDGVNRRMKFSLGHFGLMELR